ncbi:hypothetical protein NQ317_019584, partial [Molorchus minor]
CGLLGVGLWLRFAYEGYASLLPQYALLSADSLSSLLKVTFVFSFFACCGSWFQNRCMLITFGCCGVENYEDWYMIDAWSDEKWVPDSCCLPASYDIGCGKLRDSRALWTNFFDDDFLYSEAQKDFRDLQVLFIIALIFVKADITCTLYNNCTYLPDLIFRGPQLVLDGKHVIL